MDTRHCKCCDTTKPISQFTKNRSNKSGYSYQCKLCKSKDSRRWRLENPERVKELNRKHRELKKINQ